MMNIIKIYMGPARQVFKFFREDKKVLLIDAHCDTLSRITRNKEPLRRNTGHFDLERAREAGLNIQFLAMFTKERDPERRQSVTKPIPRYFRLSR